MLKVGIVDLGMCNLRSVQEAVRHLGGDPVVLSTPRGVSAVQALILPGVGAFGPAAAVLRDSGLAAAVAAFVDSGRPLLGICLGMQLLASTGEEGGLFKGLGLVPGTVRKFPPGVRVPHVGWNQVFPRPDEPLFQGISGGEHFYFVHSYYLDPEESGCVAARTDYGGEFCSAVRYRNVHGVQFHPEKSSTAGLRVLRNFLDIAKRLT